MSNLLSARGLTFRIGKAVLVDAVDLDVAAGEVVAVIGPNGAGKSTLLTLLAGDLTPGDGEVAIGGRPVGRLDLVELALLRAVLPQHIPADVPFPVATVVAMGRHPHQVTGATTDAEDAAAVAAAVAATETGHLAALPVAVLSGGERTRVALARVLAQDTPLLLLDEPAAALDVAHQERLMHTLRTLAGEGKAVVTVLHDLNLAASHADRIVVMEHGAVRATGAPHDVMRPDLLRAVYHQPMLVQPHPTRDRPLIVVID